MYHSLGVLFLKRTELSVSAFGLCVELCLIIENTCRIMGIFWQSVVKIAKKGKGCAKVVW